MFRAPARMLGLIMVLVLAACAPGFAAHHGQETGFLDRTLTLDGVEHRYVVYLPQSYTRNEKWPVILFLHGSGERGSEGLDETQIGLPAAIRVHPERWPFVVVMPQVPFSRHHWTDPDMMEMAMAALHAEVKEFHGDPNREYLTGLSLGGYGVWELARENPHTFAAIVPMAGGIFWSYAPERWREQATLPAEYAHMLRHVPAWLFHGADDPIVVPKESELMYQAMKAAGGNVRYWEYAAVKHNVWERGYATPELPHWLLSHSLSTDAAIPPAAEKVLVPVHPPAIVLSASALEAYTGEYEFAGVLQITVFRDGDALFQRSRFGQVTELLAENANTFFFPSGGTARLIFERGSGQGAEHGVEPGAVRDVIARDDRHEEHWQRRP